MGKRSSRFRPAQRDQGENAGEDGQVFRDFGKNSGMILEGSDPRGFLISHVSTNRKDLPAMAAIQKRVESPEISPLPNRGSDLFLMFFDPAEHLV